MCQCCLSLFLTVLVETLTFVGQWLRRVLDVAYLCWWASRTCALSSRPVVVRLLPECGRSFTSPGFSLCLLSILYTVLCDICIVWAMCDTVAPAPFIPMTYHHWLMVLFPIVKLTGHKKLTFGVAKVVLISTLLFKDYMVNFTHFCQTCYQVYTNHIDNFSGSHSMSNTMKNKFGKFLQELFPGVYLSQVFI